MRTTTVNATVLVDGDGLRLEEEQPGGDVCDVCWSAGTEGRPGPRRELFPVAFLQVGLRAVASGGVVGYALVQTGFTLLGRGG